MQTKKVILPGSKSETNRGLILQHITQGKFKVENPSNAADSRLLMDLLKRIENNGNLEDTLVLDCGPAGTTFRFLTALCAFTPGKYLITGSARMKERPISDLVEALTLMGAQITYQEKEGYPPLAINGLTPPKKASTRVALNTSSQFLSALLLLSPFFEKGLEIKTIGKGGSKPYINMTLGFLEMLGAQIKVSDTRYLMELKEHRACSYRVNPDWSAASYWYLIALALDSSIILSGLKKESLQGDAILTSLFKSFGINTHFTNEGARLVNGEGDNTAFNYNFSDCPDLAQSFMIACVLTKREGNFAGLDSLKVKETDRILAMQQELAKIGWRLEEKPNGDYHLYQESVIPKSEVVISTYEDHRMAMAFAPLAILNKNIAISNPEVVDKSYPNFWKDINSFNLKPKFA
ncbi:3-phosphoshikimate 1-carboxyvinyltransferase [Luteibaculum oceani]|uniref:3-phosphoshikimate 1-carboxyvinyltransferase n=1 Tax=Luteibaculum oceani TaxID=1294296 RepID=A0A5C6VAL4_9FLAO|nr:3-phosphoshikimate 1-carboxyvinyltransferase [Luteibaculum oceani]TXC81366.1 3-phosphoshikimate 1-carboxyvinyltransferase [Luteibaculum oceani]